MKRLNYYLGIFLKKVREPLLRFFSIYNRESRYYHLNKNDVTFIIYSEGES